MEPFQHPPTTPPNLPTYLSTHLLNHTSSYVYYCPNTVIQSLNAKSTDFVESMGLTLDREQVAARAAVKQWLEATLPLSAARTNGHMTEDTPTFHTYGEFDWDYW